MRLRWLEFSQNNLHMAFIELIALLISCWLTISSAVSNSQVNCTFDENMCGWENEQHTDEMDWIRDTYTTTTRFTGPSHDVSGSGWYIYLESSLGRPRDRARLISPLMNGSWCMTFYYNLNGATMSCITVYIQTSDGLENLVWIKSGHWGDRWIKSQVEINNQEVDYRIIVEGIRGRSYFGDAALDVFNFTEGHCQTDLSVFHVVAKREDNNEIYRIHALPAHDEWRDAFSFKVDQSSRNANETMYFVYPPSNNGQQIISKALWLHNSDRFPIDFFWAGSSNNTTDIFEIDMGSNYSRKISAMNESQDCCSTIRKTSIPVSLLPETNVKCYPGWTGVGAWCLRFFVDTRRTWDGARAFCRRLGGDLAVLGSNLTSSSQLIQLLQRLTTSETHFFVGLRQTWTKLGHSWLWTNGRDIKKGMWKNGYPTAGDVNSCGALINDGVTLVNTACTNMNGFICESFEENMAVSEHVKRATNIASVDPSYIAPSFQTAVSGPKWTITLLKTIYVHQVAIDQFVSCCDNSATSVYVSVMDDTASYSQCAGTTWNDLTRTTYLCLPPIRVLYVVIDAPSHSNVPAFNVAVSGYASVLEAHGTHRKLWYRYVNTEGFSTLRENPVFQQLSDGTTTTVDFSANFEVSENYGEQLIAYLQVPKNGNYTFSLSCGDECELWLDRFREEELDFEEASDASEVERMLVQLQRWASYSESDRCLEKKAKEAIYMSTCRFYLLKVYMKDELQFRCLSVGMAGPKPVVQAPILGQHLHSVPTGKRSLSFTLISQNKSRTRLVALGSTLHIRASYRYCCQGMYCPDCPIILQFHALGNLLLVNPSVKSTCSESIFEADVKVVGQPGTHPMEISFSFVNDTAGQKGRRQIGQLEVKVASIAQFTFSEEEARIWKVRGFEISGGIGIVNKTHDVQLESPLLPWKPLYFDVGLCLHFSYKLPTKSDTTLNVYLKTSKGNTLIWRLRGYQGNNWGFGQVSWAPTERSQVLFEGLGRVNGTPSIIIDNVAITTETCEVMPSYASPSFVCEINQFQCFNGQCTSSTRQCDSDINCIDGSDEEGCTCLRVELPCPSGGCVPSSKLCDGNNDCSDGKDEQSCHGSCSPDRFQCADGTCIPWSSTCVTGTSSACQDQSDTPSICGRFCNSRLVGSNWLPRTSGCPLNNLNCNNEVSGSDCETRFKGQCSFDTGFCGLKHDNSLGHQWILHSGSTPSTDTGPTYDHTTYSKQGTYIYMEASQRHHADRVRLMSTWIASKNVVCLQFWYHMFGKHTGHLNAYVATNRSEVLAWTKSGNQGDRWMFAQATLQASYPFKFILEGVTVTGNEGDIAVDDVTLLEEACITITQKESPNCNFDNDMCGWQGEKQWQRVNSEPGTSEGHLSLTAGNSKQRRTIASPLLVDDEWKCMRFWYKIGLGHETELKLFLNRSNEPLMKQIWTTSHRTSEWSFIQLPINTTKPSRVIFEGVSTGAPVLIDDVLFSKQSCREIPWATYQEFLPPLLPKCLNPLGMQDGRIPDSAITASSYYRARSAPPRVRLHLALPDAVAGYTGGWCIYPSEYYEWLQVDFGFLASIRKVATQGKQEQNFWVTKYFLSYRQTVNSSLQLYRQHGNVKVFDGNWDRHTVLSHHLIPPITAQFVRIYPYRYHKFACLRVEYYGCAADTIDEPVQDPCYAPLGMQNGQIPNASITASSNFGSAHRSRLYTVEEGGKPGAWVAAPADQSHWLQVDLGGLVMVRGLATQGRHGAPQWVSSFVLSHSSVGTNFRFHQVNFTTKVYVANSNQNTVVMNSIRPPVVSRYIRVHPRTWVNEVAIRIEIFGCLAVDMNIDGIEDLGCYSDTAERAIPLLEAMDPLLDGSYMQRAAAVRRCAKAAYNLHLDVFAVQNGGQCLAGPHANVTYHKYGTSTQCQASGRGGPWANQVYRNLRRCNVSEWCEWHTRDDGKVTWSLNMVDKTNEKIANNFTGENDSKPFSVKVRNHKPLNVTARASSNDIKELTVCYWIQADNATFSITYTPTNDGRAMDQPAFDLYHTFSGVKLSVMKNTISTGLSTEDNIWHHVCVSWTSQGGIWRVYKDGKLLNFNRWLSSQRIITGVGEVTIEFRQNNQTSSSQLSGLNMWNYEVKMEGVARLSLGCAVESGNLVQWSSLRNEAKLSVYGEILENPSCISRNAIMSIVGNSSEDHASLVSPWYNRSAKGYGKCLRFSFIIYGPGAQSLEIHQELDLHIKQRRIWKETSNTHSYWRYGQVSLTTIAKNKLIIKGVVGRLPGYIAVGGLYWVNDYCEPSPLAAVEKACNENFTKSAGYIISPYHPGFYPQNIQCTWRITAPVGHVISLKFLAFQLKYKPLCTAGQLVLVDGYQASDPIIGIFCGLSIPTVIESSGNKMLILFKSGDGMGRTGFKLHYSFKEQREDNAACAHKRDCPTGCSCFNIPDLQKSFAIQGDDLRTVPKTIPSYTTAILLGNNRINQIQEGAFSKLLLLEYVDLSNNIILVLSDGSFQDVPRLNTIKLNGNFVRDLSSGVFSNLHGLQILDLGENQLQRIPRGIFHQLPRLRVLSLRSNEIRTLESGLFPQENNLTYLYLQNNGIEHIPDGLFKDLSMLKVLYLNRNRIRKLSMATFEGLTTLETLYLDSNRIMDFSPETFHALANLQRLKLDHFTLCCYAIKAIPQVDCHAPTDGFSSCDDLMKNKTLQIFIWILGILAFLGNFIVVVWRIIVKEANRVHSFLLTNLAVSDFLMGLYLLIIAIKDAQWQGEYFKHDLAWRTGKLCQFAGALSMISSEVSVAMLTIITADRLVCIVFPFRFKRLSLKRVYIICSSVWLLGALVSTVPLTGIEYFVDADTGFGFYGRSAVCLPMQLSSDRPAGWEYSVSFFVAFNFLAFMFMLAAYIAMFITAKRTGKAVRSTSVRRETAMATKMMFIILTDFLCWMPVIVIGVLSLTGNLYDPKQLVYVWIAVFVLPVNSSINPLLYTFSTATTRKKLESIKGTMHTVITKNLSRSTGKRSQLYESDMNLDVTLSSMAPTIIDRPSPPRMTKLKIIELCSIFKNDHPTKSLGFMTSWLESDSRFGMCMLKHCARSKVEETWEKEIEVLGEMAKHGEHDNLMTYRWHSEVSDLNIDRNSIRMPNLKGNDILICFDFVSSTSLDEFIKVHHKTPISHRLFNITLDVISGIEHLHSIGICHNNISPRSILVSFGEGNSPTSGVIGDFGKAFVLEHNANPCLALKEDLRQFGQLLESVLGCCDHEAGSDKKVRDILAICSSEDEDYKLDARYIRKTLEGICSFSEEDTCL